MLRLRVHEVSLDSWTSVAMNAETRTQDLNHTSSSLVTIKSSFFPQIQPIVLQPHLSPIYLAENIYTNIILAPHTRSMVCGVQRIVGCVKEHARPSRHPHKRIARTCFRPNREEPRQLATLWSGHETICRVKWRHFSPKCWLKCVMSLETLVCHTTFKDELSNSPLLLPFQFEKDTEKNNKKRISFDTTDKILLPDSLDSSVKA